MEKVPPFTPASENKSSLPLTSPLITHSVPQTFQSIDGPNQPVLNNGINADGGLTSIYEQSIGSMTALGEPYYTYITSSGNKVMLYNTAIDVTTVHIQKAGEDNSIYVCDVANLFSKRTLIPNKYNDVVLGSDGTLLGIYSSVLGGGTTFYIDQISMTTFEILNTAAIVSGVGETFINIKIAKANVLTLSSIQTDSGFVAVSTNGTLCYVNNGTTYTIVSTCAVAIYSADNLSAVWNAGTLVLASPNNTTLGSAGLYHNTTPGDYTAWGNTTLAGTTGIVIAPISELIAGATTITAGAATFSTTNPVFYVDIDDLGAITTTTAFAGAFNSSGTAANFTMYSGVVTPWGCAGIYSTSGAAPYGVFQKDNYKDNNPNTTRPVFAADLNSVIPGPVKLTATTSVPYYLSIDTFKGVISSITINTKFAFFPGSYIPVVLNDIGGADSDTDILTGNIFNSSPRYNKCFIPPDYRSEISASHSQGAGVVYQTKRGDFIYCQLVAGSVNSDAINIQEIAKDIIKLNTCTGNNQIIDTNALIAYHNYSSMGMPLLLNYTSVTASLAYIRSYNKYSTSLDYGLINADIAPADMKRMLYNDLNNGNQFIMVLWNGQTGAYVSHIGVNTSTNVGFSYYPGSAGTYVNNPSVPPGNDATYQGGAIIMPLSRAVQTPNYTGFLLPNLLASAQYSDFFILKGTFYTYDGNFIYELPLSSGVGSTLSGVPQPLLTCEGLRFLDCSQSYAYFLDNFDNSIWAYSGGREISKLVILSKKPDIVLGKYNDFDNALYLQTSNSIISMRDEASITENALPFASGTWSTYSTALGVYYVQNATSRLRTYKNIASSTLIPLNYQTGYVGYQSGSSFNVNRIKMRLACLGGLTSTLSLTWNWVTQDDSGTDTATIDTSMQSSSGYFTFEWNPPHNNVILFSFGLRDVSSNQKMVLLNLDVYTSYQAESSISNKVP